MPETSARPRPARRARTTVDGVVRGEVGGIPAFWPVEQKGPSSCLVVFRVGQADETLPTRGTTHLVEHLALLRSGYGPHDYNGTTGPLLTTFGVSGTPSDVVSFCRTLGESLRSLPLDRLETERGVLRTEEQGRGFSASSLWRLRWGPQGPGLVGYDELGVGHVDGQHLQDWADTWMTRSRCALVLSGPPPRGLRLDLPEGSAVAAPVVPPPTDPLPTSYPQSPPSFGLSYLRPRGSAAGVGAWLLLERTNNLLRHDRGLVYGVSGDSTLLGPDLRHEMLWTQALDENAESAAEALLEVLAGLPDQPMTAEERKTWSAMKRRQTRLRPEVEGSPGLAYAHAEGHLLGTPMPSLDELAAELKAVKPQDVQAALVAALGDQLLLALPPGVGESEAATRVAPPMANSSPARLTGTPLRPVAGRDDAMVVGPEGVSVLHGDDRELATTVRYVDCRAVLAWEDGARTLVGADGFSVSYLPERWRDPASEVARAIDAGVPAGTIVPRGPREPEVPGESAGAAPAGATAPSPGEVVGASALAVLALVIAAAGVASLFDPEQSLGSRVGAALTGLVIGAITAAWPALLLWQRVRRER